METLNASIQLVAQQLDFRKKRKQKKRRSSEIACRREIKDTLCDADFVDKWLSAVNVVKRRTIATDMLKSGVVMINDIKAKASKDVKIGDKVTIEYLKGAKHYEVLQIPTTKTIPKSQKEDYVKEL